VTKPDYNFAFFGTDEFSVKTLEALATRGVRPRLIVSTPDKPQGRKLILTPPATKVWAEQQGIPVIQPARLKPVIDDLANPLYDTLAPFDFFLVASYGKIMPEALISLPAHKSINIHPSLLPQYRGPAPIQAPILNGDEETGVTIMLMDKEMDHGPVLAQSKLSLAGRPWCFEELRHELAEQGAKLFTEMIDDWLGGKIKPQEQNHDQATYTQKITKIDTEINLSDNPVTNFCKIRAFTPKPGAYFFVEKNNKPLRIVIKKAHLENGELLLDRVVPEGRAEMSWSDFKRNLK
jgi:methionyl-tRNA formyltransferase